MIVFSAFVLALVISIDTFPVGFACGAGGVRVPMRNVVVLDVLGSVLVSVALFSGFCISLYISPGVARWIGVGALIAVGCAKIAQTFFKKKSERQQDARKISWAETVMLAVLLSIDGFVVGLGVSINSASIAFCLAVVAFSLVTDFVFFVAGFRLGRRTAQKIPLDLSCIGGVVLVLIGVLKLWV